MSRGMIDQLPVKLRSRVDTENITMKPKNGTTVESGAQSTPDAQLKIPKIPGLQFHHIGIACRDIDAELRALDILGYEVEGERFIDPLQKIRGCFLVGPGPRIELLAPLDDSSPVISWLEKGVKMYHQAYEVQSIEQSIATLIAQRAVVFSPPKPAIAFGGRKIAFLMFPNCLLIELIEA